MTKLWILIFALCIPSIASANTFQNVKINGITFNNVVYTISNSDYKIHAALSDTETSIDDLAIKNNAITGINGVFFCPKDYSECKWKSFTINERIADGVDMSFYPDSGERAIFWWDVNGVPMLHQTGRINPDNRKFIFEGMGNFPILFANGISQLEHYHDVWLYDSKMKNPMKRHFICSTKGKDKIIFGSTSSASLDDLTPALFTLGCWDAINLDAGASTQYLYNGRRLEYASRNVLDAFVIERVWLDVQDLENKLDILGWKLSKIYKNSYPSSVSTIKIEQVLKQIAAIRADIYDENSIDTYNDMWNNTWYEIDITSLSILKRVYLLNGLEKRLKSIKSSL